MKTITILLLFLMIGCGERYLPEPTVEQVWQEKYDKRKTDNYEKYYEWWQLHQANLAKHS